MATGLSPGIYSISVMDVGGNCVFTATTSFVSGVPFAGLVSNSPTIACNGVGTATASIAVTGGSGAQFYYWNNGQSIQTTPVASGLGAGIHTITVVDVVTSCSVTQFFTIAQPPGFNLQVIASSATVCAGSPLSFTAVNSGGTPGPAPAYTYTWTNGPATNSYQVSPPAGNYAYTVSSTDANNCLAIQTVTAGVVANPSLTAIGASICPLQSGTLLAGGATSYTWYPSGFVGNVYNVSPTATTGYTLTGSAAGCASGPVTVTMVVMPVPSPTMSSNSPVCNGQSLTLSASGGAAYLWNGPAAFTSVLQNPVVNPAAPASGGMYTLTVTAANSCTATASLSVTINSSPTITAAGGTVCTSQVLTLGASSFPGASYSWSGPQGFSSGQQNPFISNPALNQSGSYTVQATSVEGCTNQAIVNASIVSPPSLTVALSSPSLCAQAFNGSSNSITLSSSGANTYTLSTPYHILNPNPGGPVSPITSIPPYNPGIATATLQGSNGICTTSITVNFSIIPNPVVTVSSPTPVICAGQSFTYTSQGATSYTWGPGSPGITTYSTGNIAVANPSINSVFSVFGASLGCNSASQTTTITINPLPVLVINPSAPAICLSGSVHLTATGTATGYTWSPSTGLTSTTGPSVYASPPATQNYVLTGSLNSCTASAVITVSVLPLPVPALSVSRPRVCLNDTLTLRGFGGNTYQWYGPYQFNATGQTVIVQPYNISHAGTFTLMVTNNAGCSGFTTTVLNFDPLPQADLLSSTGSHCVPFCTDFSMAGKGTAPIITALWEVNGQIFTSAQFRYCFQQPGDYPVKGIFTNNLGCTNTATYQVTAYPVPVADFDYSPQAPVESFDQVAFTDLSSGAQLNSWNWFFIDNSGYKAKTQNTAYLFDQAGTYPVSLVVKNTWGCADTMIKLITVDTDFSMYVPNAFTPNGDDRNDTFQPKGSGIVTYNLAIFDRWGEQLFESTEFSRGWDGYYKGKECKTEVYVWKIKATDRNGKTKDLEGFVMLYR